MTEIKNIQCELQIVNKKPNRFLDRLGLWDKLTVILVTLITFSGIYFRLGVVFPSIVLLLIISGYFYFIRFTKNFEIIKKAIISEDGLFIGDEKHEFENVTITYKAYKNYVEWPYKQIKTNVLSIGETRHLFIIDLENLIRLEELASQKPKIRITNILKKKK